MLHTCAGCDAGDVEIGRGARLIAGMEKMLGGSDSKVLHFLNVRFAGATDKIADLTSRSIANEVGLRQETVVISLAALADRKILRRLQGTRTERARYELSFLLNGKPVQLESKTGSTERKTGSTADSKTGSVERKTGSTVERKTGSAESITGSVERKTGSTSIEERAPARPEFPNELKEGRFIPSERNPGLGSATLRRPMIDKALQAASGQSVRTPKPSEMIQAANLKLQLPVEAVARFLQDAADTKREKRDGKPANPMFLAQSFEWEAASWASANQDFVQACVLRQALAERGSEAETRLPSADIEALVRESDERLARDKELGLGLVKGRTA